MAGLGVLSAELKSGTTKMKKINCPLNDEIEAFKEAFKKMDEFEKWYLIKK